MAPTAKVAANDWHEAAREAAVKYGLPNSTNAQLSMMLLNLADRGTITVSYGVVATLVEAAARLDGEKFLEWERNRRPVVVFT